LPDNIRQMGIKDFFIKKALEYKLKDVPEAQRNMMMGMMEKDPELFKKIGEEIKQRTKSGESEMAASMVVMRKYQAELQKLAQK